VKTLLLDPRVSPQDEDNQAIRLASSFPEVVRSLFLDDRVNCVFQKILIFSVSHVTLSEIVFFIGKNLISLRQKELNIYDEGPD